MKREATCRICAIELANAAEHSGKANCGAGERGEQAGWVRIDVGEHGLPVWMLSQSSLIDTVDRIKLRV